jgi:hypothetical protein
MTDKPLWNINSQTVIANIHTGVAVNIPLPVINPPVELTAPYPPHDLPVEIYEFIDYKNADTKSSHTDRFKGNSRAFCDVNDFYVSSNGMPTSTPVKSNYSKYTASAVNYVFRIPRQRNINEVKTPIASQGIIGIAVNGVPFCSPGSGKIHKFNGAVYTENDVLNPVNFPTQDGSALVKADGSYFYNSDPKLIYTKNSSVHSPIIGFALDGWPIYGPYGFTNTDGTGGVTIMTSSYQLKTTPRVNNTQPDGSYIEDYHYVVGSGTLDRYNGRDCITPEYPNGVYAYFITVNPNNINEPIYPYVIGSYFKSKPIKPNGNFIYPGTYSISVISGQLPPGLRISDANIVGTAYSIKVDTNFRFVLRAQNSSGFSDRTLVISVIAQSGLLWETPSGSLPVGNNNLFPIPVQFDPNRLGPDLKLSNYNLTISAPKQITDGSEPSALCTYNILNGVKIIFSVIMDRVVSNAFTGIGIAGPNMDITKYLGDTVDSFGFWDDGSAYGNINEVYYPAGSFPTIHSGDIVDVAVDRQNYLIWMRVNGGHWNGDNTQDPVTAIGGVDISFMSKNVFYPAVSPYNNGTIAGQFTIKQLPNYTIPHGFTFVGNEIIGDVYYVLDNGFVDYQLSAVDKNLALSQDLNFYIPPNGGHLPGGLTLSADGKISGFTKPVFSVISSNSNGNYDENFYDVSSYDYGISTNNGFDSFLFDVENYDFYYNINIPRKLNRYYQFIVRITDGYYYEDRQFKIYVVGDDHLRADTTLIQAGTNFYRADASYLRKPIWLTPNYLGTRRANNYVTIPTSIYISDSIVGVIYYILDRYNDDGSISRLPIGLELDEQTGTIYGSIPYQPAISITYKFTIRAYRYDPIKGDTVDTPRTFTLDVIGEIESVITFTTAGDLGTLNAQLVSSFSVSATTKIKNTALIYSLVNGKLPPGLILFNDGTIQGKINQFYNSTAGLGLTTIDRGTTTFDKGTTRIDRQYIFTVKAADQLGLSATTKTFSIEVATPYSLNYSNIFVKPFLNQTTRINVLSFLNNINIFTPALIYRPSDREFGVQKNLQMLLYPGIETTDAAKYVAAFGRSYKKQFRLGDVKKAIAKIPGTNTVVYEVIYIEVIDNQEIGTASMKSVIDINNRNYPITVNQGRRDAIDDSFGSNIQSKESQVIYKRYDLPDKAMSADYDGQKVSDKNKSTIFGNSVTNIRNNISKIGDTERDYLPLWMRTAQTFSGVVQNFTKAIPLCYCVPGGADAVLLNIKESGFDFKSINYTIDRAIIDSVTGSEGDKYLMFPAREVTNG